MQESRDARFAQRGQIIPFVALSLVVLLGAAALAVDLGVFRYDQRLQQSAADSAALAGAAELAFAGSNITTAARTDAATNGFTNGSGGATVTVNHPPLAGAYVGDASAVEVIVSASHPDIFGGFINHATTTVASRAVALLEQTNPANCITDLGNTSFGFADIIAQNCGIVTDGNTSGLLAFITASSIGTVGSNNCLLCFYPEAQPTTSLPASDPCQQIPGCAYLANTPPSTTTPTCTVSAYSAVTGYTVSPGASPSCVLSSSSTIFQFCGFRGGSSVVTFGAGIYVINGGFTANGCILNGSSVTFYIASGALTITTSAINLSAPTTGNTTGILFYQVPSDTDPVALYATVSGLFTGAISGGLYFPDASLTIVGNIGNYLYMVADGLDLSLAIIDFPNGSNFPGGVHNTLLVE
jgi:Putative Flp pilus-assembly TadE/G-like